MVGRGRPVGRGRGARCLRLNFLPLTPERQRGWDPWAWGRRDGTAGETGVKGQNDGDGHRTGRQRLQGLRMRDRGRSDWGSGNRVEEFRAGDRELKIRNKGQAGSRKTREEVQRRQ